MNKQLLEAVSTIARALNEQEIPWAIIGSTNMAMQGIDIEPHDLDIVVPLDALDRLRELFKDYNPSHIRELEPLNKEPSWDVTITIDSVEVQFLGQRENGEYLSTLIEGKTIAIHIDGANIPCLTLDAEADIYASTRDDHASKQKRDKRAKQIREFL